MLPVPSAYPPRALHLPYPTLATTAITTTTTTTTTTTNHPPQVLKMYFVGVASTQPYRVDMDSMYVFDTSNRVLSRAPLTRVHENIREPILRIR